MTKTTLVVLQPSKKLRMSTIAPSDSRSVQANTKVPISVVTSTARYLFHWLKHLYSFWGQVQVSRQGAYTSRRARALQRYVHSASLSRVLAVCILTPVPVLSFVLLQEWVPLDAPSAGWKANYRWFARSAIIFMTLAISYIQQGVIFLAPLKVSRTQVAIVTLLSTGAYFGALVGVSDMWVFPIPFAGVLTTGTFTCLFFGVFIAVVGRRAVATTPQLTAHARIFKSVLVVETIIVFVYPAFNAAFRVLRGTQQLAFLAVLFALKVIMRFIMAYALRHSKGGASVDERWRARLPEVVVFSTELFHVLYLTACLQGQHVTIWTTVGLSLIDSSGSLISVRRIVRRPSVQLMPKSSGSNMSTQVSLSTIVPIALGPPLSAFEVINSTSSLRLSVRRQSLSFLPTTRRLSSSLKLAKRSSTRSHHSTAKSFSRSVLGERATNPQPPTVPPKAVTDEISRLETLSMTEYFLLVEYVKLIIPVMYGVFQVVLARLPNSVFYPSLADATPHDLRRMQMNLLVFVSMEIVSLTGFVLLLQRRLHFSMLHQVAFVLETAADDIQAKLAMFIPYCFFFFLEHNGTCLSSWHCWQTGLD